jgi:hypothetical protein
MFRPGPLQSVGRAFFLTNRLVAAGERSLYGSKTFGHTPGEKILPRFLQL